MDNLSEGSVPAKKNIAKVSAVICMAVGTGCLIGICSLISRIMTKLLPMCQENHIEWPFIVKMGNDVYIHWYLYLPVWMALFVLFPIIEMTRPKIFLPLWTYAGLVVLSIAGLLSMYAGMFFSMADIVMNYK